MDRRTYFSDVVKASCEDFERVDVVVVSYENFERKGGFPLSRTDVKITRQWKSTLIGFAAGYFLRCVHVRQPDKVFKMLRVWQSVFC